MTFANSLEPGRVALAAEAEERISGKDRETMHAAHFVPQVFEANGGIPIAAGPQQGHHLAERMDPPAPLAQLRHHASDQLANPLGIGCTVDHDSRQGLGRVEDHEPARCHRFVDVNARRPQRVLNGLTVRGRCDDDARVPFPQRGPDKPGDRVDQERVALVELDEMLVLPHFAPVDHRRGGFLRRARQVG